jgi:hypothetical protein
MAKKGFMDNPAFATGLNVGSNNRNEYDSNGNLLFPKGTLRSNHKNMYDSLQPMKS